MRKLEGRAGRFSVWHVGKMAFVVEQDGVTLGRFTNLSDAFVHARWLQKTNGAFV